MLFSGGGTLGRVHSSIQGSGLRIGWAAPGIVIRGSGNTIESGEGFTVEGSGAVLVACQDVHVRGSGCVVNAGCRRITIQGSGAVVHGSDCTVTGSDLVDHGERTTWHHQYGPQVIHLGGGGTVNNYGDIVGGLVGQSFGPGPVRRRRTKPRAPPVAIDIYPPASTEPESETDDETRACMLCLTRVKTTTVVPCGHCYACVTCVRDSKPTTCAVCRGPVERVIRLFQ